MLVGWSVWAIFDFVYLWFIIPLAFVLMINVNILSILSLDLSSFIGCYVFHAYSYVYHSMDILSLQECGRFCFDIPNFNFNVSHHGDYVAIASEPLCLVGLDIVNFTIPEKEIVREYIQNFSSCFSSLEWDRIITAGSNEEVLTEFYRYWCLKEAYVKAIGSGLGYGLHKVEFHHINWRNISVKVDGVINPRWRFWLFDLGKGHWVSIARGHPRSAVESYKRSLKRTEFNEEEYNVGLHLPNPRFVFKTVEELISVLHKALCSC